MLAHHVSRIEPARDAQAQFAVCQSQNRLQLAPVLYCRRGWARDV